MTVPVPFPQHHAAPGQASAAPRSLARIAGLAAAGLAAGCLSVPEGPAPMCNSNSDCDRSHGEVCEEGICWGDPPPGTFAGVLSPPAMRQDLVSRELPQVAIPDFGWMGDLALEAPVLLSGKIVAFCPLAFAACDQTPLAGTIVVSRRSRFQGGPGFRVVVDVAAGSSFAIPVPLTRMDDPQYTVTVLPQSSQEPNTHAPAELVPPLRMQVAVTDNTNTRAVTLGGLGLPAISGHLFDRFGAPVGGYRVVALGRWDPTEPIFEVSTVAYTDTVTGAYSVTLSDGLAGPVELVARPTGMTVGATVHVANLDSTRSTTSKDVTLPASLGAPVELDVVVQGLDASGTISPVSGAQVAVSGATATSQLTTFTMSDQRVTDARGVAVLHLLNGDGIAGTYRLAITPPASSPLGVVFNQKVPSLVGLTLYSPLVTRLGARVALRGKVLDNDGKPLGNAAVTARPSLRFLWTLDAAPQAFVAATPAATAITESTGAYVVWVDPSVPNVSESWGSYDLLIEPTTSARLSTLTVPEVSLRGAPPDAVTLPDIQLPDPAFVHGRITGPDGKSVQGAELKLYRVTTQLTLCSEVAHAPASCPIPAQLLARNTSDSDGTVRLILAH